MDVRNHCRHRSGDVVSIVVLSSLSSKKGSYQIVVPRRCMAYLANLCPLSNLNYWPRDHLMFRDRVWHINPFDIRLRFQSYNTNHLWTSHFTVIKWQQCLSSLHHWATNLLSLEGNGLVGHCGHCANDQIWTLHTTVIHELGILAFETQASNVWTVNVIHDFVLCMLLSGCSWAHSVDSRGSSFFYSGFWAKLL